ncbi:Xaa-Pro aminopeptidase [Clostridium pasteurianum DSM 525 = ATCC 6013]|jgi:Xaa-Pro aminopeptidase|uniref:Peptidase M24 n=1 Tax=Clostridium pasteurianum DSM 525 = ATCC 6013 TaxID=1262449 RepID=A0A0H3J9T6_CLOPA|nr:Xaa-Pro peptidase family protein [Clostridium pasteurianum]AJA47965.1 Xaa-Pro aminopeptidase [Clostridium pasteurianum DSM 525 = ATCC 6013]AJA51953.1 Xaa-Pro aminopeptidase [Clostridium pasteurianum DSM 525 = ATCC 6013]AOZ75251.1 Xaa-Pro dipeptidase [Clostridium pasteurianum DSM 525 = ATCC 6013]AOZ79046.1 Xaa-Pro dipeptidase [Clostridium pasteurianum]ELP59868.1 Xaa-Pro dipeptidase [Clostridium pasteurianum DSM 525 = ATCC 6013]
MFEDRLKKLRESMKLKDLDAVLVIGDPNRNYLSGFTGDESFSIITDNKALFITDSRYTEQARNEVKDYEILEYKGAFPDFFSDIIKKLNVKKIGFEDNVVSYELYSKISGKTEAQLVPMKGIIEEIRLIKDKSEIESIKKAADIADKAFSHMLKFIKTGMSEREIGLELEFTMKKLGAKDLSFPSIVASGVRSSLPHGKATDKIVENGEFLTLDFGCIFEEYCSDMTRTVAIGEPDDKLREIYNVVLEAQEKVLKVIKPGVKANVVDSVAREYISEKGYGSYFGHGLGHGVGREIHEAPRLSPMSETILKEGMIVTDEPGIYIPEFGGVRIEDLVLVTKDGCETLSKSPKKLIYLGV